MLNFACPAEVCAVEFFAWWWVGYGRLAVSSVGALAVRWWAVSGIGACCAIGPVCEVKGLADVVELGGRGAVGFGRVRAVGRCAAGTRRGSVEAVEVVVRAAESGGVRCVRGAGMGSGSGDIKGLAAAEMVGIRIGRKGVGGALRCMRGVAAAERLGGDRVGDEAGDVSCRGGMAAATGVGGDWVGREGVVVPRGGG